MNTHMAKDSTTPIWRTVFDAVEGPLTRAAESRVQTNRFMDGLALSWRVQRRLDRELRHGLEMWLGALSLATRGDVERLSNEVARVERELRALRRELERGRTGPGTRAPARPRARSASGGRARQRDGS